MFGSWLGIAAVSAAGLIVLFLLIVAVLLRELFKSAPTGGSRYALPNGMVIQHWQALETDFLFREIFGDGSEAVYNKGVRIGPGQTIIDAGANIGMFSLYCALKARGDARILSFEPIPTTYAVLAANAAAANAGKYNAQFAPAKGAKLEITPFNMGLSDSSANVEFEHHPRLSIWSTGDESFAEDRRHRFLVDVVQACIHSDNVIVRNLPVFFLTAVTRLALHQLASSVKVPVTLRRLSDVLDGVKLRKGAPIDVLKVDVEGAELSVLRGIRPDHWALVQQVVMEVETFAAVAAVSKILVKHGFAVSTVASEKERNPHGTSEVSMVYGIRPGYKLPHETASNSTTAAAAEKKPRAQSPKPTGRAGSSASASKKSPSPSRKGTKAASPAGSATKKAAAAARR